MSAKQTAAERTPGTGERIVVRRRLDAAPGEVFSAWTNADQMKEWMKPGGTTRVDVDLDVRVGGSFTIDMFEGAKVFAHRGEYVTVDPPRKLAFTWSADWIPGGSLVTLELTEREGGTELVLTHERLPSEESARNHEKGWGEILDRLAGVLERG